MRLRLLVPALAALSVLLAGCAGRPPAPDWQLNAKSAADQAVEATLSGDERRADAAWDRARAEIARTGRIELLARLEILRCATRAASLEFAPCDRFQALRADAAAPEIAYADYLAGAEIADRVDLLPSAQREASRAGPAAAEALAAIEDPVARLVAAAVAMRRGHASPAVMQLAAGTAAAHGWRRPLIAWLQALALRAEQSGDLDQAALLRRRIEFVLRGK